MVRGDVSGRWAWRRRAIGPALAAAVAGAGAMPVMGQELAAGAAADRFVVTGTVDSLYDTNVLRGTGVLLPNRATAATHQDDFRVSPSVSASYNRSAGRVALAANALVGYDFFRYNRYLNNNRYAGGGTLTYRSGSSCQASVNGNISVRQDGIRGTGEEIVDPSGAPTDNVGTVIDNVATASTYGANLGCGTPTGRLTFGGGYSHGTFSNASSFRKFGDSDSDTYTGNIGIGILRPGQVSLNGSYSTIAYPNRIAFAPIGVPLQLLDSGVATYRIGITVSRPIGTRLSGSIGASFLHADPSGGQAPYSSPAYSISLNYAASPRLGATLSASRDISPSASVGALFRVVDQILLTTRYELGRTIVFNANVGLLKDNYQQGFAIPGEPARSNDTTTNLGVGVTYHPRALFDINFNVSESLRRSNPAVFDYNSTRVGLTFAVHI